MNTVDRPAGTLLRVKDPSPKSRNQNPGCHGEHNEATPIGLVGRAYMPSDRWYHAVFFYQKHMRLKYTPLSQSREHEYLLARRQVCSRCRSKGYDWRIF